MTAKGYKRHKRGGGRHVQLQEAFQRCEAWATLKPGPRALYIELKRRFNGSNNGSIRLSHREAAALINVHRNSVPAYFEELERRGLIRQTREGYLGADGHGIASTWRLCELATENGGSADWGFRNWTEGEKQKPGTAIGPPRHSHCATGTG